MEVELKLEASVADAATLLGDALFDGAETKALSAVYFDTEARTLRKAGFSLRVRQEGERRIQTVKASGPADGGLFTRDEWEREIDGDRPVIGSDLPLTRLVGDAELDEVAPIFRAQVERAAAIVTSGDATIELVLDRGEIVAADRRVPICEVELELRAGPAAELFALARRLDAAAPVRIGALSKSERGYRLADDPARPSEKARPIALTADMTAAAAFQAIAAACIRQFRLNETLLVETGDAGALHQARVGLRRLRSALSLFRPMLADARADAIRDGPGRISGALGEARDIDVLVERVSGDAALARLALARDRAYADVAEALTSWRMRHLMIDLAEWLALGDWLTDPGGAKLRKRPVRKAADHILDHRRRRVKRRGANLAELDDERRHELRIETKKLRYATEFFAPLYARGKKSRRARAFLQALEALQQELGDLNDLATMPGVLARFDLAGERSAAEAIGDKAAMLARAERAYVALLDTGCFWS